VEAQQTVDADKAVSEPQRHITYTYKTAHLPTLLFWLCPLNSLFLLSSSLW